MYMKKILAIICVCAMMIGVFGTFFVTAAATGSFQVGLSKETASRGEEIQITVQLQNNPGVWSLAFEMPIDTASYEFVSADTTGSIFDQFGVCGYDESTQSYKFNAYHSNLFSNVTSNGKLVVLTLRVKDSAALAKTTFTVNTDEENTVNYNEEKVEIESATASVTIQEYVASSTITSADMVIGTDMTVNYYAKLDPIHTAAKMRFTMNEKVILVNGTATGKENEYVFPFVGVTPQCMGDNIKAELVLGEKVLATKEQYSVREYCVNTLSKTAAELEMSAEKYAALRTLIADMLEYGAKAQVYRGYHTNTLANAGITGQTPFTELTTTLKYTEESSRDEIMITSAGVYFDYATSIYIKFLAPGLNEDNCYVTVFNEATDEETEYLLSDCQLLNEETSEYLLIMDPMHATGYNDKYVIDLYAPRSATSSTVRSVHFLEYSLSSYVYSMQNKTSNGTLTPMAQLARATYNYGLAASAYAAIEN